ncbi:MAG TPA: leucine--tRNA ligase [Firmicutes bacterium]|nr:leucine--tRNA ligase [Bacillota bacterium]
MEAKYDFRIIEPKWQDRWAESRIFETDPVHGKEKYYVLEMYPYPSGSGLHMGNTRVYSIGDVYARYKVMKGFNVIHPMGFDSFGLPAENAAIKEGADPGPWTEANIELIRKQINELGFGYDWRREVACHRPDYYRWTQWLFNVLFKMGLAYRKDGRVNYCPNCKTVLANEQAEGGICERCKGEVEPKKLTQWYFKTTAYAQRLLDDMEKLKGGWPERVLDMQRAWIGRSEGCMITFPVPDFEHNIDVYTTRPDTLHGCTYMVLAPEHPFVEKLTPPEKLPEVRAFVRKCIMQGEIERTSEESEKEGMHLGRVCINPINNKEIPILIGNYVLAEYGTGAVMCVPAHDTRDFMFANKYSLPIVRVIKPVGSDIDPDAPLDEAFTEDGTMVNCGEHDGMHSTDYWNVVADFLEGNNLGGRTVNFRLRDWLISRQRYWGAPIPIIHCEKCGPVAVPDDELPVLLPSSDKVNFLSGEGSPLASVSEWLNVSCPNCKGAAKRETDTMDTFVDSSWYFLRYCSPDADDVPFRKEDVDYWCPMDLYIGGPEHAIMHLLYFRFVIKALNDAGYVKFDEPAPWLLTQGIVMWGGHKMSKSKGNVEDPQRLVDLFGADTTRLFTLFVAPPERDIDWEDHIERGPDEPKNTFPPKSYRMTGMEGAYRFLGRVWRLVYDNRESCKGLFPVDGSVGDISDEQVRRAVHHAIREVTLDIEERKSLNTAIARMMELSNALGSFAAKNSSSANGSTHSDLACGIAVLLRLLSPFAPHIAEECWDGLGAKESIFKTPWPEYNPEFLASDTMTIVVQINGKLRDNVEVPVDIGEDDLVATCRTEKIEKHLEGKQIRKTIVVRKKLVNFVV